jgi:hypothetical protein
MMPCPEHRPISIDRLSIAPQGRIGALAGHQHRKQRQQLRNEQFSRHNERPPLPGAPGQPIGMK